MNFQKRTREYLDYCKYRKELDANTLKAYRIDLCQYFDHIQSDNPGKHEIEQYITTLHKKYKQKTIKRKIASIKAFYAFLEDEELLLENPFRRIKVKFKETSILPRIIPKGEIERLLNYMYAESKQYEKNKCNSTRCLRDTAIIEMLFATGARVYEISNIQSDCIDLDSGLIRIMGKGGKERYVQIVDDSILTLLRNYYNSSNNSITKSGYFFVNQRGNRFSEQSIRNMIKKYARLAGISRTITPHMFRHSFATYLIENGLDVSCVQQILGHSSIKTTQIYIHIATKKQTELLKTLHPRNQMQITGAA